jgi:hypothetical protein
MSTESYEKGCEALKAQDYKAAEREFCEALKLVDEHNPSYNRITSCLGLARVLNSDRNGLLLCRDAASSETSNADVFLHLACAEWHCSNRERAIDAVVRGRNIDAGHQQLARVSALLDSRRRNALPFLPRDHFLNRTLGRLMRREHTPLSVHKLLY